LNALVNRIVCAVGFRETMWCFRLAAPFFPVALLPGVLADVPAFAFPLAPFVFDPEAFPAPAEDVPDLEGVGAFLGCGLDCGVAGVVVCACPTV
jgi:hypothetical protein